jgi:hypothetical protein
MRLQRIEEDANFTANANQLILFDFYRTAVIAALELYTVGTLGSSSVARNMSAY